MATVDPKHRPWQGEKPGLDGYYKSEAATVIQQAMAQWSRLKAAFASWQQRDPNSTDLKKVAFFFGSPAEQLLGKRNADVPKMNETDTAWKPYIEEAMTFLADVTRLADIAVAQKVPSATSSQPAPKTSAKSEGSTIATRELTSTLPPVPPTLPTLPPSEPPAWTGPFGLSKRATIGLGVTAGVLVLGGVGWFIASRRAKAASVAPMPAPVAGFGRLRSRKSRRSRR